MHLSIEHSPIKTDFLSTAYNFKGSGKCISFVSMIDKRIILISLFCTFGLVAFSQEQSKDQSTSVESIRPQKDYAPKPKKKSKGAETTFDARNDFYDRQELLSKQKLKNEKEGSKPQYSDQKYFGHKREPKKRPPSKMKFCNVCGIRH